MLKTTLKKLPKDALVSEILEVTGETDLLIYANANDTHDLNRIIDSIRIVTGTKSTKTRVILNEY